MSVLTYVSFVIKVHYTKFFFLTFKGHILKKIFIWLN